MQKTHNNVSEFLFYLSPNSIAAVWAFLYVMIIKTNNESFRKLTLSAHPHFFLVTCFHLLSLIVCSVILLILFMFPFEYYNSESKRRI